MLAFNLGIFFRNLQGAEVRFSARSPACEFHFCGTVEALQEQVDLSRRLNITLRQDPLLCHIAFEDSEDESQPQSAIVDVRLVQFRDAQEQLVTQTRFRFEQVSLQPKDQREPAGSETGPAEPTPHAS